MFPAIMMRYKLRKMGLKIYEPEKRIELQGNEVAGRAINAGTRLALLSEGLLIFTGWIFYPFIAFLGLKEKFREFRMRHDRVVDIRTIKRK